MTEHSRATCSRCGADFVPLQGELRSEGLCTKCLETTDTGSFHRLSLPSTPVPTSGSTEQRTVFPSDPEAPIYSGKTIKSNPDAGKTIEYRPARSSDSYKISNEIIKSGSMMGRFEIRGVLGRGSFGLVYRAYDCVMEREVALKMPRFTGEDDNHQRFLNEAKAAGKLKHPNIVVVYESGEIEGQPFIAAELVDGIPLSQTLKTRRLTIPESVELVRQISEALSYAHSLGIVHRDVKPGNVMVATNGRPQLMDFGLAKQLGEDAKASVEDLILGTPAYMSPEQARGKKNTVGKLSDQYSVGAMFYELLTGKTPYDGELWTVVKQVSDDTAQPLAPRSIQPNIPRDLEAACLKAMEKNPSDRYSDLSLFADDLKRWLAGQPLMARPLNTAERLVRWYRRSKALALSLIMIALFIVGAAVVGNVLAFHFNNLATEAVTARNKEQEAREHEQEAREQERQARLGTERLLVANYTESSLVADRMGDPRLAQLWNGYAVEAAKHHPDLERECRRRFAAWQCDVAVPIHARFISGGWCESLKYHPSSRYLLIETLEQNCKIIDLQSGDLLELPNLEKLNSANWNLKGDLLAVAHDNTVSVFDFPSGRERACWEHEDNVQRIEFSPQGDKIAVCGTHSVRVRDLKSDSDASPIWKHPQPLVGVNWSPDGSKLVTLAKDDRARLFSVAIDAMIPIMPELESQISQSLVVPIFPNENTVLVVDNNRAIRCWNLEKRSVDWERKVDQITCFALSPDRKTIAFGERFQINVLDALTGNPKQPSIAHRNVPYLCEFSNDGKILLTGGGDQTIQASLVGTGQIIVSNVPHTAIVHRAAYSPDGQHFATVEWTESLVRVWRCERLAHVDYQAQVDATQSYLRFNTNGQRAISVGFDQFLNRRGLKQFDVTTGNTVGATINASGFITDAVYIPQTNRLLVLSSAPDEGRSVGITDTKLRNSPGEIRIIDASSGETIGSPLATPSLPIAVDVDAAGEQAMVLCDSGALLIVDPKLGTLKHELMAFDQNPMVHGYVIRKRLRYSPKNDRFILWGSGNIAEMRDAKDGSLLFRVRHQRDYVHDVVFSPDGSQFATCGSDQLVRRWRSSDGEASGKDLMHAGWVLMAQYSRDGQRLITASSDRQARLWDLASGSVVSSTREHADEVYAVAFAPDESCFVTGCRDGQVRIWDMPNARQVAPDRKFNQAVFQLAFSPDGSRLLVSGGNRFVGGVAACQWSQTTNDNMPGATIKLLGELISAQSLHSGGEPMNLNREEWLDRWNLIRSKSATKPALDSEQ